MLYAFGDESYPTGTGGNSANYRANYLVITVLQDRFKAKWSSIDESLQRERRGRNRQRKLVESLGNIGAKIAIGTAELPKNLFAATFRTSDAGNVALRSAAWCCLFGFTCSVALCDSLQAGSVFSIVDFYYDPNTLGASHKQITLETMKSTCKAQLSEYSRRRFGPNAPQPSLRRVIAVPKAPTIFDPPQVQIGVSWAHQVLTFTQKSPQEAASLGVAKRDFSQEVVETLSRIEVVRDDEQS